MIVAVFDPLAVLLLIAGNLGIMRQQRNNKASKTRLEHMAEYHKDQAAERRYQKLVDLVGKDAKKKVTIDKNKIRKMT
jgi:hypothetical protein